MLLRRGTQQACCCAAGRGRLAVVGRAEAGSVLLLRRRRLSTSTSTSTSTGSVGMLPHGRPSHQLAQRPQGRVYAMMAQRAFLSSAPGEGKAADAATGAATEAREDTGAASEAHDAKTTTTMPPPVAETETGEEENEHVPLFSSPAPRFFRLLAGASLTQIAFWTSYSWLPDELGGHLGYVGIVASGAFVFIARHFAKHYLWEVDAISPVAFRFAGHTFWGNKGEDRVVQVGTTQMQQTSRYIAFKVKGDSFWYLLDVKEGKFKDDEAQNQLVRMFQGLRPEGLDVDDDRAGAEGEDGGRRAAGGRGAGGRRWKGGRAKK